VGENIKVKGSVKVSSNILNAKKVYLCRRIKNQNALSPREQTELDLHKFHFILLPSHKQNT
jgi:hypothetical protein